MNYNFNAQPQPLTNTNNQPMNNQQQINNQVHSSNLDFYHDFHIATRFGVSFTLVSEDKKGKDGVAYKRYSVMIKIIPPGNEPMTYDSQNAFTMKTSIEQVAALSGALLAAYYGRPVNFTIFTDSSKSNYVQEQSQKIFYVSNIDRQSNQIADKISVGGMLKINGQNKVSTGVTLSIYDAYAWHKMLDKFIDKAMEVVFTK